MSNTVANLTALLRTRAKNEPERRAYLFLADGETETASLTWADLHLRARAIAAALAVAGARGERVLLLHPPGLEFVAAFFGCLYAGAVAVPSQPPHRQKDQPRLRAIAADARPRVVLGDSALVARREEIAARVPELAGAAWIDSAAAGEDLAYTWNEIPLSPDSPAFLQYTSGSTSTPKGVIVTHANLVHNEEMIRRAFGQSQESVIVGWLPLYHDMGLIGNVLQPLYAGASCVLMPPLAFLRQPARWLRAIDRYRATTSGGPNFAYDLCVRKVGPEERAELDLSSWKLAFNGAEPVRAETLERFAAAFAESGFRREAFYPCYGLAEATLFVSGGAPGAGPTLRAVEPSRELVGCGRPWLDQEVVIADPETGAPLPDGQVGEVLVAGPSVAAGYWGQPEETARTFAAGPDGRFLRTGDLGFVDGGELFLNGRIKELIILRGRNLYPHDVERTAEASHPALRGGVGAAFSVEMDGEERLVLVHEVARTWRGEVEEVAGAVRHAVALEHEARVQEVVLVRVGSVLRTSSGKIRRRATREAYLAGELAVVAAVGAREEEDVEAGRPYRAAPTGWTEVLAGEAARALRLERVDPDVSLIAQGLDSLGAAELQSAVEARTGVALSMTALLEGASLRALEAEAPGWELPSVQAAEPDAPGEHPVSEGQRALWFQDRLAPEAAALHLAGAARVQIEIEALRRAAGLLARRHAALRTTFHERDGEPVRRVHEWLEPDVREGSIGEAFVPFDLESGPLMRLRVAEGGTALLVGVHHLVADYASVAVLLRDLAELVQQRESPPPGPGYTAWVLRRESALDGPRGEELREWWRERLSGELPVLDLPVDRPARPGRSWRGVIRTARVDGAALREVGRKRGATLYAVLLAGLQAVLHRWTGQDEALIAAPTAGRDPGYEGEIGYFVNPVVLRLGIGGDPSFEDLLARAGRTAVEAFERGAWPFARLVRDLRVPPLQTMFVLQPVRTPEEKALAAFALGEAGVRAEVAGLEMESLALPEARVQSELTLMAAEVGKDGKDNKDGILLSLQLDADLFDASTAERLLGHLTNLLTGAAVEPGRRVSEIEILSGSELAQIASWSAGPPLPGTGALLPERIAEQAARQPGAVALVHGEERWTYGELWGRALRLAARLRSLGVGPEVRAGICSARTPDMVAAMLAVLEAGGAYVPLDPAYPAERLALLLEDSGAALVLADALGGERLPSPDLPVIRLGEEADHRAVPAVRPNPENLAWLIYTSGSTGRPKAVGITHGSAAALADWTASAFPDLDGVLASTSIGFDLSVFEILVPLSRGGRVVLAGSALDLPEIPASAGVRLVNTVPSAMSELLRAGALPASVETVSLAGEPLRRELARGLFQAGVRRVANLYGPSEDTTYSTIANLSLEEGGEPPIGRPIAGTTARALDWELRRVPQGVSGELFLGGAGLARGYLGRPDLTAERFVPSPFPEDGPGARLYRTGDRVRWRPDGQLAFLGRLDHQVKVRGFRIELGEAEAALSAIPGVEQAAVVAVGEGAERRLVAFLVGPRWDSLRDELAARLPAHMIPSAFVFLDALPLNPNGKVDRKALAALEPERSRGTIHEPPRTPVERRLAAIWDELLGVGEVGVRDSFFELGGHSLLLTLLVSRMREAFGVELSIGQVFAAPTIAAQAMLLEGAEAAAEPILPAPRTEPVPLSFGQERLWFIDQLEGGGAAYNVPAAVRLSGPLDRAALARALSGIVERHEALRTSFPTVDGRPVQEIAPALAVDLSLVDLSALASPGAEAARIAFAEARIPFDLARGPLARATLLRLAEREHQLLITLHHAVADGWSLGVFLEELSRGYGASEPLPPLPVQYADWTVWQRRRLEDGELDDQIAWWREHLAGAPPRLEIPSDRPRPPVQSFRGGQIKKLLPAVAGLGGATQFMTLYAAFAALLQRITGEEDLVIGTPVANRTRGELEGLVGFFVNVLPMRAGVDGGRSFRELVTALRPVILEAFHRQEVPFERLVAELRPERVQGEPPLTQVLFTLQNAPMPAPRLEGLEVAAAGIYNGTAKLDLAVEMTASDAGLVMILEHSSDLFDPATAGRITERFEILLREVAARPDVPLAELDLLGEEERRQISAWERGPAQAAAGAGTVVDLFVEQARRSPDSPAFRFDGTVLTYAELERRAATLARHLASRGVGPGRVVGLCAHRSPELAVGVLGILAGGGVFLPLDPAHPPERLSYLVRDSGAALVLADGDLDLGVPVVPLTAALEADGAAPTPPDPGDPAYLLYTSGTTGLPKGVLAEHGGLRHTVATAVTAFGFEPGERMPSIAPFSFDIFLFELLAPLLSGGMVSLLPLEPTLDLDLLAEELRHATRFHAVPGVLRTVVDRGSFASLREVYVGGDSVPPKLLEDAKAAFPSARLRVLYGPTEGTVFCAAHLVNGDLPARPVLGRPLPGNVLTLRDRYGLPVPGGTPGEVYLGGPGVTRGYLNRPDLTADRYLPAPDSRRFYRTGDLARWRPDGSLEFLGRADAQVKVRGVRIEPGEVEAVLAAHPGVRQAAVIARGERGETALVAFYAGTVPPEELRVWLAGRLPGAMVPAALVPLPELPLTSRGKVDRRALAAMPLPAATEAAKAAVRDPMEEMLAEIWAGLIGVERVGPDEDFFALGGHSLLATRVVSRVRQAFGVDLPLRALFEAPTVAKLARRLRQAQAAEAPPLTPQPRPAEGAPLSFAQQRLWFLWRLAPDSAFYNMPAAIRLLGPIDPPRLALAFGEIVRRHESLRTRFPAAGGRPVQAIDPPRPVPLPVVDLSGPGDEREIERIVQEEIRRPFDLARGPVLRTLLLKLGPESALLVVNLHHIVSDAWSVGVLYRELAEIYRGAAPPALPVQYADFAIWQRAWLQGETLDRELAWWRERLSGLPPTDLPYDRPRPAVQSFRGATFAAGIPPEVAGPLRTLSRRIGATLFMTLLAGFKALVHRYTGREDVIVGTPVANRERIELERLVGFFVNTLAMRTDLSGRPGFHALVERVRETALEAWAHQSLPFEKIVEELAPERDAGRQPIFQQMFQLVEMPPSGIDVGGLVLERLEVDAGTTTFDLALDLHESPDGGVAVRAVYSTDLFDEATIRRLAGHLTGLLAGGAEDPDRAVGALFILSPDELRQILLDWNGRAEAPPGFPLAHEAFEARARLAPDAVALVCEGERLTYGELNLRANRMAHQLISLGAGPEVTVGVLLRRSPRLVVALLAVLKAGAVYLPLDPALPRERLDSMLADAGAAIVIAEDWEEAKGRKGNPKLHLPGEALAYVIYTSGSTGRPKGVGVSHRVLASHVRAIREELALDARDTVLQFASASFDVSLEQLLPPLVAGARVVLRPEEVWTLPELLRQLDQEGVTVADLPAAYWSQLAHEAARGALPPPPPKLRLVLAGGEALRAEAVQRWRRGPFAGVRLLNAYGPTETAVTATVADLTVPGPEGEERVPIGQAVAGRGLFVLDPEGGLAPAGVPGELFVGGSLLARGYLGRPDQTAERFVPDLFSDEPGARLYRTGDLVRRLPDGRLEFVGRADRQLKVRGFRIEPGEIEAALLRHPAVREAVVVAREDDGRDRRLAAYVTCDPEAGPGEVEDWEEEQVEQWREVYDDDVYGELPDPTFNISGWASSYTRGPIPAGEMREWLDATVDRIFTLLPAGSRVLEIGCGTGLVLFRVAPRCARYVGTDFSAVALEHTRSQLDGTLPVELRQGLADDPAVLGDETFDAVFLNSVVQYFPSLDYLLRVLEESVARVAPGGFVFIGDVRSLPLLPAFHASVELHRAPAGTSRERLARRVEAKIADDPELVIDPAFFAALRKRLPRVSHVEIQLRRGRHRNELTRFRYDAVLHVGRPEATEEPAWLDWEAEGLSLSLPALRGLLAEAPDRIGVRGIPNDRVAAAVAALALLRDPDGPRTAGELRQVAVRAGIDPEDLWEAARDLPYEVGLTWSRDPGRFDAVLRRREEGARAPMPGLCPPGEAGRMASDPLRRRMARKLAPRLKAFVAERLPAPMVPADVVILDELPLNARGKVDLRALPAPERTAPGMEEGFVPPRTPEERAVADVWAELLGLDQVGAGDDFFALGGHSLLATQVLSRVRQGLGVELELRQLFEEPTVAGLAARVREAAGRGGEGEPPLVPIPRTEPLPLSFGQRRLWFLYRMDPRSAAYNMAGTWRLAGLLDVPALAAALSEIVRRHEVLRTTCAADGEEPVQVVHPPAPFASPVADLSGLPPGMRDAEARRLVAAEAARPFDLERGPVLRVTLVRLARREHLALVTVHHIACDGWSIGVLIRELGALYAAAVAGRPSPLPEPPLQYGDFAAWQRRWLDGPALAVRIAWWKDRLAGAPPALELPSDRPRPAARSQAGGLHPVEVPAATVAGLAGIARAEGATLFAVLLAAFQTLLGRLTGEDDLVVGTPVAGRRQVATEELIGFFVNTLALRADLAGDPAFRAHLEKTQNAALDAFAHQDLPFERLVEELRPERSLSHAPVFQVLFALQNAPGGPLELPGLTMEPLPPEPRALFDLELNVAEVDGGLSGVLGYALDLFEPATAGRLVRGFLTLIAGIAERPEARLSELPLLSGAEIVEVLEASHGPVLEPSAGLTVLDLFAAQAARTPDAEAVAGMTYRELDLRSRRFPVRRGEIVALRAERSADFVVELLGVMRAGAAWLPLDPSLPEERAAFLLADSGARPLPEVPGEEGPEPPPPGPGDLAYVIYTSGTTGRPKGVMVEHGSLLHTLRALLAAFPFGPGERMVSIAPFSFDIFLFEVLAPLLTGGSVTLPPIRPSLDIDQLLAELETATRFHAVPAVLRQVVDRGGRPGLREIYTGGDLVPPELIADARRAFPGARVAVLYGPTEGTIVCAAHPALEAAPVRPPLGCPLAGVALELRDRFGGLVPDGVPGEVHIGGPGVARGYLGRPDLTAERFLPAPGGARVYRTGDLARRRADGALEFLGRADDQVKVRGFRIEPGEIEARLAEHPGVRRAAAVVRSNGGLAAFFVPSGEAPSQAELRAHLLRTLPDYMVPAVFAPLEELPLTANAKVDRRALAARPLEWIEGETEAPRTPEEEIVAGLWAELLGVERIGPRDDVFERGAHSLLVTRAVSRLREAFGVELPLRTLFEEPTSAGQARRIAEARATAAPPIHPVSRGVELPLSFAQQRLWFLEQMEPGNPLYNMPAVLRLRGPLDAGALARALTGVVGRHEALRTVFPARHGRPRQEILPPAPFPLPVADLAALPPERREAEAWSLGQAETRRLFDLAAGPLLRGVLLRIDAADHVLALNAHHIVSDGWSTAILIRETAALYGGPAPLPPLPVQYVDFAVWQRQWLVGETLETQLAWWRRHLEGAPPALELPTDRPRPPLRGLRGAEEPVQLPRELADGLVRLGRREGATLYMTLLAGFQALLHRWSGQDDFSVGAPVAGRGRLETEGLIGFFVNTLVMRTDLAGDPSFRRLLARVREEALDAWAHQDLPFEKLVEELDPARDPARTPLFQVVFALQDRIPETGLPGLEMVPLRAPSVTAKFDFTLALADGPEGLTGAVEYSTDLFDPATVRRLMAAFERLLRGAVEDPDLGLAALPLLGEAERHLVTVEWAADTRAAYPRERTVHELFTALAALAPDLPALSDGAERLTYAELDARADHLARRLRAAGAGPEDPVAVLLERSAGLIVALLAVLKAGGAYVPLDPSYPPERLAWMLDDCGARLLIAESLPAGLDIHILRPGEDGPEAELLPSVGPQGLAYVLYTSGSTGRPKGVEVPHRAIIRLVRGSDFAPLDPGDRVAQGSNAAFDAATFEIWGALLNGAELVVAPPRASLVELGDFLERERITALWLTASLFHQMVDGPLHKLAPVRQLLTGGEVVSAAHVRRLLAELPGRRVVNGYGPTENTTFTCCHPVETAAQARSPLPVGRPIANTRVYLLDAERRPVPPGVAGELCAGGDGLARGYLRRPDLTAERFVPDPFGEPGSRLYRTGDLARWLPDGNVEFLGRLDGQVKLRGFRIEPGEIEAAAAEHPAVRTAVVLPRPDGAGGKRLVGYLVPSPDAARDTAGVRAFLRGRLPDYMVPAAFVWLDALPVNQSGKVDRRALERIEVGPETREMAAPRTPIEEGLAGIWRDVLGVEAVGPEDDFFDLGGHSLLATQVASRVREAFGVELPLRDLFAAPRLDALAARIEEERRLGAGLAAPPVTPVPRDGGLPLSFAQEWMWVVDQLSPSSAAYNAPIPVRLRGALAAAALEAAWREVARRHEILRTRFVAGPLQQPDPALVPPLSLADLTGLPAGLREPEAALQAAAEATRPFDLAAGPPARALLLRLDAADHLLVLNLHHIVTDGWSAGVLLRELAGLYDAARAGSPSPLPALPVQYGDFAVWQRKWLSGEPLETLLAYWRERLAGPPPVLELPVDRPGAAPGLGERLPFHLGRERTALLREIARGRGTTLFVVLLAAFQTLLARYSRQEDLVVGTPVANRTRRELEDLIGYFVNNLALRTDLGGDPAFPELLDRVHETTLGAWSHQDLPILKLIQELHPERAAGGAMPLFRVWFQLQNTPLPRLEVPGLTLLPYELESRAATFDLELLTLETDEGIAGHFVYGRELFLRETAEAMLRNLLVLIEGIADDPGRRLSDLPLLSSEERQALLIDWNPAGVCRGAIPLHQAFEAVAAVRPEAPAVTFEGQTLTYRQLDRRANALAHRLREQGVGPESRVGLSAERSLELVVGILGILKAGGVYVPLDPDYPQDRLSLLLEDAGVQATVTAESLLDGTEASSPPDVPSHPDHLAYVIYTSGSTGRPKGVMVTHRQAARLFEATRSFGFGPEDVWTLFHSYAFDFSVWELWGALLHGGRLVVVPRWVSRSPEAFLDLLAREEVTVLNQTPSAFYQLIQADTGRPLRLRWVIFGGEALEPLKLQPWFERRGDESPVLVNMYGITETTVHVTLRPLMRADARGVIGRALDDLRLYLLDAGLGLAPVGAVGEIFVGGGGVARGYLGRPDLTAERFVPDPFAAEPGARLYRSGDLARWRPGGELEYLGRADQQLKVRGFRIEPGEIEAALVRHPAVAQAAVIARRLSSEDVRLAACVVIHDGASLPAAGELREHLLALLPEPWVPGIFVPVPALPLTPHGKVDRRVLEDLVAAHTATVEESGDAPASPLEELLAQVWAGLLEVERVGRDESFFALGGHSLLMTRVASRVREALGVAPPMRSFFDRPTVANLAAGLLGELTARLEPGRLEALAATVRDLPDAEVASLVTEKRAALLARVVPSTPVAPTPAVQTISVTASTRALPGEGALERLAARGDAKVREVLAAMADAPAEDEPLRVETIAFPTRNRPEVLERGIASYAKAARERGRTLRFAVLDDSPEPAVRDEYRQRLAGLRRRFGCEIVYAGQEEKRRFREGLIAAGVPPEAVAMALTDPEGVGVPVGANRNCVLLQTLGEGALSVDDDTVGLGGPPPESLPGVAFLSGTDPGTAFLSGRDPGSIHGFGSRAGALAAVGLRALDLAGVHEELLGRQVRPWLSGLDPEAPAALGAGDPGFLRDLERGGRVLVTTNGWAGDCGWRSPTFYMLLTGDSWRRLTRSPETWRAATASKEIVRFVPRPTVGNGDSFMATLFTGLDNRRLLPPFPPVLWGEDLLFGVTLQLGVAGARVGHLPGVAVHDPLEHRAFWPGEMVRSASGVDHSRLVAALLDGFAPDPDASAAEGLRRLGAFLMECGRMEPRAFDELAGQRVRARAEAFAAGLEARLAAWNDGDAWTADVRRYLDLLRRHMGEPDFAVPLDLLYGREPEEARRLARRLILNHGKALAHWPDLVAAARALKSQGRGLAEAIP